MWNCAERRAVGGALLGLAACSTEAAPVRVVTAEPRPQVAKCAVDDDCDDGLVCSGLERCLDGRCWSGRPPVCDDRNACTRDLCLEPVGCAYEAEAQCRPDASAADASVIQRDASDAEDTGAVDGGLPGYVERVPAFCAGSLLRGDVFVSEAATLEALRGVRCIDGDLTLKGPLLDSLLGLAALRWVGGDLRVLDADALEQLTGLDGLEAVDGDLELVDIRGAAAGAPFGSLREVGGAVRLAGWTKTVQLQGFAALRRVQGAFTLERMPALSDVAQVFPALESIGGNLRLAGLPKLQTLDAFHALTRLDGTFKLEDAPVTVYQGFEALEVYRGEVRLPATVTAFRAFPRLRVLGGLSMAVPELVRFEGLPALEQVSGDVIVTGKKLAVLAGFDRLREAGSVNLFGPLLTEIHAFQALEKAGTLELHSTALTTLPFPKLVDCGGVTLDGNAQLSDISSLRKLRDASPFSVSLNENPLLTDASALGGHAQLKTVSITKNRSLRTLGFGAVTSVTGAVSISINPALSRCEAELLVQKRMPAANAPTTQPYLGCNRGCGQCQAGVCQAADGVVTQEQGSCPESLSGASVDLSLYVQAHTLGSIALAQYSGPRVELPGLKRLTGGLELRGATAEDLAMFRGLEEVGGNVTFTTSSFLDLSALSRLRRVGGRLSLYNLAQLTSLALPSLRDVASSVDVANCPLLSSCQITQLESQLAADMSPAPVSSSGVLACAGSCQEGVCQ